MIVLWYLHAYVIYIIAWIYYLNSVKWLIVQVQLNWNNILADLLLYNHPLRLNILSFYWFTELDLSIFLFSIVILEITQLLPQVSRWSPVRKYLSPKILFYFFSVNLKIIDNSLKQQTFPVINSYLYLRLYVKVYEIYWYIIHMIWFRDQG